MKLFKDLLYTVGNQALDIARLSSFLAVLAYLSIALWQTFKGGAVSLTEFGTGWAATAAGCAAWIYARQAKETTPGGDS